MGFLPGWDGLFVAADVLACDVEGLGRAICGSIRAWQLYGEVWAVCSRQLSGAKGRAWEIGDFESYFHSMIIVFLIYKTYNIV